MWECFISSEINKALLKIILEVTRQRDSESLQRSLLFGLADWLPALLLVLYRPIGDLPAQHMGEVLKIRKNEAEISDSKAMYSEVISGRVEMEMDPLVKKCINLSDLIIDSTPSVAKLYLPIVIDKKISLILLIEAETSIIGDVDSIKNLIKIFENVLSVVNESEIDKLTGLYNRRIFETKISRMLLAQKTCERKYLPVNKKTDDRHITDDSFSWLVILDIDFFKRVNDGFGHVAGDEVLLRLSQIMQDNFRDADLLFRYGGEEFLVILEPIEYVKALAVLERFRKTVESFEFPLVGSVTISLGFAKINEGAFPATILDYADKALYYAKKHGRNCVFNYEKLVEQGKLVKPDESGTVDLF